MPLTFAIFTFINVWWITLFVVLPFGVKMAHNKSSVEYAAAPKAHQWKRVFLINSCISLVVTGIIALLIHYNVVSLKNMLAE